MSRPFPRISVVAILALALGLAVLTPAAALPTPTHLSTANTTTQWIAVAWEALRVFLTGVPLQPASAASDTPSPPPQVENLMPLTGACIDPMGRPVPCGH